MATVTEGYVTARAEQAKAEMKAEIVRDQLIHTRWIVALVLGGIAAAAAIVALIIAS